ncbi:hypothetical protein ANO11243_024800 [Dothideomycetidae sp. 11243]|nr:hypothetical protein ANO11243_024800 [fungal sp. No.11243]
METHRLRRMVVDHEYGPEESRALAIKDAEKARHNADNYEYFAMQNVGTKSVPVVGWFAGPLLCGILLSGFRPPFQSHGYPAARTHLSFTDCETDTMLSTCWWTGFKPNLHAKGFLEMAKVFEYIYMSWPLSAVTQAALLGNTAPLDSNHNIAGTVSIHVSPQIKVIQQRQVDLKNSTGHLFERAAPAITPFFPPDQKIDAKRKDRVLKGFAGAFELANSVLTSSPRDNDFQTFFGQSRGNQKDVLTVYRNIVGPSGAGNPIISRVRVLAAGDRPSCSRGPLASFDVTDPNKPIMIICDAAFDLPDLGAYTCHDWETKSESQIETLASIILHELTHWRVLG